VGAVRTLTKLQCIALVCTLSGSKGADISSQLRQPTGWVLSVPNRSRSVSLNGLALVSGHVSQSKFQPKGTLEIFVIDG